MASDPRSHPPKLRMWPLLWPVVIPILFVLIVTLFAGILLFCFFPSYEPSSPPSPPSQQSAQTAHRFRSYGGTLASLHATARDKTHQAGYPILKSNGLVPSSRG